VAENRDARLLILTSDPRTVDEVTGIGKLSFRQVTTLYWEMGNLETKPGVLRELERTRYDLLVSYINGIILQPRHLAQARAGAINIHPAPPEHGGAWGLFCQPVIRRDVRVHHGVTVHELDEQIDHGPIYRAFRWDVDEHESIQSVNDRAFAGCLQAWAEIAEELGEGSGGTQCLGLAGERWHPTNRHHTVDDVRRWFASLDPDHPAHRERVPFNHPRAIPSPPYFDDV
jgi:methionyl-tRNA formyltransferase